MGGIHLTGAKEQSIEIAFEDDEKFSIITKTERLQRIG